MKGLNRVELIGNLGEEPEMRFTQAGKPVTTFSLATSRKYTDAGGVLQEDTTWHKIVTWENLAESCNKHLNKGNLVYLAGRIANRSWVDNAGVKHYASEIVANEVIFLSVKLANNDKDAAPSCDTGADPGELPF